MDKAPPVQRIRSLPIIVALCLQVGACGGGNAEPLTPSAQAERAMAATGMADTGGTAAGDGTSTAWPATAVIAARSVAAPAVSTVSLSNLITPSAETSRFLGVTPSCREGFVGDGALDAREVAALPDGGGFTYSDDDIMRWRQRATGTRYVRDGDVRAGSPGDWTRIATNAARFLSSGEALINDANRARHGSMARDAAFFALVTDNRQMRDAVASYLLQASRAQENDFSRRLCHRELDGSSRDGFFEEGPWLLRHVVAYDYVRRGMTESDRLTVENYFRRQAYFFAAHLDWGLAMAFPKRLEGDYQRRARDAAPLTPAATWYARRFDTNGDCRIDELDDPREFPVRAYVTDSGLDGPQLSRLSQWFNNRRSANVAAFGSVGVLLNDAALVSRAKRYVMEWLTFAVAADGSEGEYSRNGNYCVPKQGLQYGQANFQAAAMLATWLARRGDHSLAAYDTRDGLFGTEVPPGAPPKSLALLADTHLRLVALQLGWYMHEPWRHSQLPRAETHLGRMEISYLAQPTVYDTYHELGMLAVADVLPGAPVVAVLTRDPSVTAVRFPGSTGNRVSSGVAAWSDAFGALPGVLFMY